MSKKVNIIYSTKSYSKRACYANLLIIEIASLYWVA